MLWRVLQVHLSWWAGSWRTRLGHGLDRRVGAAVVRVRKAAPGPCTLREHRWEAPARPGQLG